MYHYVYRVEHIETKEFYIGSRSSKKHPSLDSYLGSMKTWKPDKTKLKKIILKDDFKTRDLAIIFESDEIKKEINDNLNRNYHIPNVGFCLSGRVTVKDIEGKCFTVAVDDPRYLSGELLHITKGILPTTIFVKDKEGRRLVVSRKDPRYLSGELVWFQTGFKHSKEVKDRMTITNSINRSAEKNSQFGTKWICNLELQKNKKIKSTEEIPAGWILGKRQKHWE